MSISRRQFFRGLAGQGEDRQRERRARIVAVEAYVRTNLLPYDFAISAEQVDKVLEAAVASVEIDAEDELLTYERRTRLRETVENMVEQWREGYLRAEERRREAIPFVAEFLSMEATPEDLLNLRQRFCIPYPAVLEEEVERQVRAWLSGLSNARLAECAGDTLRDLVFSELRSWC